MTSYAHFTNHPRPVTEYVEITIYKRVDGDMPNLDQAFEFTLTIEGVIVETFTLTADESATFTVPVGATYTFTEINIPVGFRLISVTNGHGTVEYGIIAEFVNRFDGNWYIDIEGEKTWVHPDGITLPDSIIVRLMNGNVIVRELIVTPDYNGYWHFLFENLPKHDTQGNVIIYTIVELPIESWSPYVNGFNIVNTYIPPAAIETIPVEKIIIGDETPLNDVQFRFTLTGHAGAPMPDGTSASGVRTIHILGEGIGNFGSITFRSPGIFVYTIVEVNTGTPGYVFDDAVFTLTIIVEEDDGELVIVSQTLTRNGEEAYRIVFINEYTGTPPTGTVTISGQKFWNHGTNPEAGRPTFVTFMLFADGELFVTFMVDASTDWWYSFELPRYNQDGSVIVWTVDEQDIPGYRKYIDGHSITNVHHSVPPDDDRPPGPPATSDDNNLWLWAAIWAANLLGLIGVLLIGLLPKKCQRSYLYAYN